MTRKTNGQFGEGNKGRPSGVRNRLQLDLLNALAADFQEHGDGVVRIVRAEKPTEYLKTIASILPKELLVSENVLGDLTDDEINTVLAKIRDIRDGEAETS